MKMVKDGHITQPIQRIESIFNYQCIGATAPLQAKFGSVLDGATIQHLFITNGKDVKKTSALLSLLSGIVF
jgi:hypothetical protein